MLLEHPLFEWPKEPDSAMWRYMDLKRFIWLLHFRRLWFSQVDQLEDLLEGSLGRLNWKMSRQRDQGISAPFFSGGPHIDDKNRFYYVNCWHLSNHESMGMWKIYTSRGSGIAIKTSIANLKTGVLDTRPIYGGIVSYVDHETELIPKSNGFSPYLRKGLPYSYENEFRMVHVLPNWEVEEIPIGIEVEIDPTVLIGEVIVAPNTGPSQIKIVKESIASEGYSFKVSESEIDRPSPWSKKA